MPEILISFVEEHLLIWSSDWAAVDSGVRLCGRRRMHWAGVENLTDPMGQRWFNLREMLRLALSANRGRIRYAMLANI